MKLSKLELPLRTALLYLLFGFLWILLSDQLLSFFLSTNSQPAIYQTLKDSFFILVSSMLLYLLLRRDAVKHKRSEDYIQYQAQLLENVNDAILATDEQYILRAWNPAAERMYGWRAEEVIGRNGVDVLQTMYLDGDASDMRQKIAAVGRYVGEVTQYRKDGTTIQVELATRVLRDDHGRIIGYVTVNRDITKRKEADRENAWLASFPERNPNPIAEIDASGTVFYMNPTAQHKFPDLPMQGFGHPWLAGLDVVIHKFQQGDMSEFQREIQIGDAWYSQPVYYVPEAERVRVYGADITQRKQAEENVQRNAAMLRAILDQMPSGVTVRDAHTGELILSNARSREIMGTLVKSVGQFAQYRGFHRDGSAYQWEDWPVSRSIAHGEIVHAEEVEYQRSDGTHVVLSISSAPVRDEQGQILMGVGIFDDITDRKQVEVSLQRLTEDLGRSNAELEQFAYIASHDLQEPLRMVSSYMQLLSKRYQGQIDSDADEFIGFAVDGAKRMQNLINDLLTYSRVGTRGKPLTEVSSEDVLNDAMANLQFLIEENQAQITYEPLPVVHGDAIQLGMVFQNLLGNAIKFRSAEPPRIHIGARQTGSEWTFSVRDNGIGIEPRYYERIFVIFQRLNDRATYPGTGIGLAICKRIVERHGGSIWVESKPGEGATFYFTLPSKETS